MIRTLLSLLLPLIVCGCAQPVANSPGERDGDTGSDGDVSVDVMPTDAGDANVPDAASIDVAADAPPDMPVCTGLFFPDNDNDGFGDMNGQSVAACAGMEPAGHVPDATDCNDGNETVYPGAMELCDGLDNNCDGQPDVGALCPCTVEVFEGHAYMFCAQRITWVDARNLCADNGYHLVTLDTAEEDRWVRDGAFSYNLDEPWSGFNDRDNENDFRWEDGTPVVYTNWDSGEPNDGGGGEDCTIWRTNTYVWDDRPCGNNHAFICENE